MRGGGTRGGTKKKEKGHASQIMLPFMGFISINPAGNG
jgi:hypothetical protein